MLRRLAERAAGGQVPLGRARAAEIWRLANEPEGGVIELGGGVEAHAEHGHVRFTSGTAARAGGGDPARCPGVCRFGAWEVRAELEAGVPPAEGPDLAVLDPGALGRSVTVRAWREGDRMRPLGLDGTKSLQDLFTDRKVPRSLRHALPVVDAGRADRLDRGRGRLRGVRGESPAPAESAVLSAAQAGP